MFGRNYLTTFRTGTVLSTVLLVVTIVDRAKKPGIVICKPTLFLNHFMNGVNYNLFPFSNLYTILQFDSMVRLQLQRIRERTELEKMEK